MSCRCKQLSEDAKQELDLTHDLLLKILYFCICVVDNLVHATAQVRVFVSHNLAKVLLIRAGTGQTLAIQLE